MLLLVGTAVVVLAGGQSPALGAAPQHTAPQHTQSLDDLRAREAQAHAELEGSTAAVQAAGAELARIAAEMPEAERQSSVARGELAGAQAKAGAARAAADRAEAARVSAQGEVEAATEQVDQSRDDVARLARRAYQRGRLGDVRDVMEAAEPKDALERGELLRSVFRSGTASIDRVTDARLLLAGKTAQLKAEEKAATKAREEADAQEERAAQVAAEAEAAVARVATLISQQQAALTTAEALREEDQRSYQQAQADSAALAERIRKAEEEAARRAAAEAAAQRAAAERAAAEAAARASRAGRPAPAAPPPPAAAPRAPSASGWIWPGYGRLTSSFGWRTHPIYGDKRFHAGIDLGGGYGAPVLATRAGTVILSGPVSGYGTLVTVSHGDGLTSSYAHMSALLVSEGDSVQQGQVVGRIGNEGNSTGPHLHFEIRRDGDPIDPLGFVSPP